MSLFKNPILGRLEELLWAEAYKRYLTGGGSPFQDLKEFKRRAGDQFKGGVSTSLSDERKKLDLGWREYKRIVEERVLSALRSTLQESAGDWYSIEVKESIYPIVLAVPTAILRWKIRDRLPALFAQRIQFQNLSAESLAALADDAMDGHFPSALSRFLKERVTVEIKGVFRPAIIVDELKNDFYHFGDRSEVLREDMVILHSFKDEGEAPDRPKKAAHHDWTSRLARPDGRPDDRRFLGTQWGVPPSVLSGLGRK